MKHRARAIRLRVAALLGAVALAPTSQAQQAIPEAAQEVASSPLTVGGAIRFNYVHKSWQHEYRSGFFGLDTARLDVKYDDGTLIGSAQYRYNRFPTGQGGYWQHFLHHGWVGMRFADQGTVQVGLNKVPFGLLPFASNNFYESIGFYTGFEDKHDLGVTYASVPGPFQWHLGFYPRDGGSYGGGRNTAGASNRYTYNIVADDDEQGYGTGQADSERNTVVGRMAWQFGAAVKQEAGVSALTGAIRSRAGKDTRRNAVALHYRARAGAFEAMLQAARYSYHTSHAPTETYDGLDANSFVMLGAFGYPYPMATRGDIHVVNIGYDLPWRFGPFGDFKVYNDYSVLRKRVGDYKDSVQNVTGLSFSAGKWFFYADLMMGRHHPYLSPDFGGLAATSRQHDGWTRRINLQAGYYF